MILQVKRMQMLPLTLVCLLGASRLPRIFYVYIHIYVLSVISLPCL